MGIPSVQVWLGQEATIDADPTWVDITAYVRLDRGLTVTRGSTYGSGAQPGTASLTLDNTDGRFTVGNASSPLYPYVHLQSLVKMYRDGRPWFIGRVQSMPLFWPGGGDTECYVTVTLADRLARFGRMSLRSFPVEEILATDPAGYWPMAEASGATGSGNAVVAAWPLNLSTPGDGTIAFGGATGPAGDGQSSPHFTPGTIPALLSSPDAAFDNSAAGALTISAAFATTLGGILVRFSTTSDVNVPNSWDIHATTYQDVPGILFTNFYAQAATFEPCFYPAAILDGATHIVTVVIGTALATRPDCYVDGVAVTPTTSYPRTGWVALSASLQVGSATSQDALLPVVNFTGTISHVAAWPRAITASEAASIHSALVGTTLTAQAALLKVLGWRSQATGAAIDAGVTDSISSKEIGKGSLAAAIAEISASEAGTLYVSAADVVTWKNRRTTLSPMVTLTAADIDGGVAYNNDLQALTTLVSVTQGGATTSVRADDITTIGEISGSVTCISTVAGDGADHASWAANTGPRGPYIGSLKVDLATSTSAALAQAITGDILAGVTLTGMPSQTPPNSTKLEITGTSETVSATGWEVTWTTTPAGLGSARDLLILDDATFGVLDSTHRLAY